MQLIVWAYHVICFAVSFTAIFPDHLLALWLPSNLICMSLWRHQMKTFSAWLARPVTRSCEAFFDLRLNKLLSKQSKRRLFETPSSSLWRHCYVYIWFTYKVAIQWHIWTCDYSLVCTVYLSIPNGVKLFSFPSSFAVVVCARACVWGWACVSVFCMPFLYAVCWMGVDVSCFIILCYL